MTDDTTPRLGLPLLYPGQASKENDHNEALVRLDLLAQPVVQAAAVAVLPPSPLPGQAWIVAVGASGDWAGRDGAIALWTTGGWRFVMPGEGMAAWSVADGGVARFLSGRWQVASRNAAIAEPEGGSVIDTEARAAVKTILGALRDHGLIAL